MLELVSSHGSMMIANGSRSPVAVLPRAAVGRAAVVLAVAVAVVTACGGSPASTTTLNLGYFPNVSHAPALVGVERGLFAAALGTAVQLNTFTFTAGPPTIEALFSEAIDIAFIGPSPTINAFAQSDGAAIRIISGSTSGGAFLVVKPDITSVDQLIGRTLATPALGNTQDVALRSWLLANGLATSVDGGGDVSVLPQSNETTLDAFVAGAIDGAWVPEPWATRLIDDGGGSVLVDERDLWPDTDGRFVTTHVVVRTAYLEQHADVVNAFLAGLLDTFDQIAIDPAAARADVATQLDSIVGRPTDHRVLEHSFDNLTFGPDPVAASLEGSAQAAIEVGLLDPVDLDGIYDLTLLNGLLAACALPKVEDR